MFIALIRCPGPYQALPSCGYNKDIAWGYGKLNHIVIPFFFLMRLVGQNILGQISRDRSYGLLFRFCKWKKNHSYSFHSGGIRALMQYVRPLQLRDPGSLVANGRRTNSFLIGDATTSPAWCSSWNRATSCLLKVHSNSYSASLAGISVSLLCLYRSPHAPKYFADAVSTR